MAQGLRPRPQVMFHSVYFLTHKILTFRISFVLLLPIHLKLENMLVWQPVRGTRQAVQGLAQELRPRPRMMSHSYKNDADTSYILLSNIYLSRASMLAWQPGLGAKKAT